MSHPSPKPPDLRGPAVGGFILSIISVLWLDILLGALALAFSAIGLRSQLQRLAVTGLSLSIIAIAGGLYFRIMS